MEVESGFGTDIGRKRRVNEDSLMCNDWLGMYAVADGMGGHSCGDVASQTCLEIVRGNLEIMKKGGNLKTEPEESVIQSIVLANSAVYAMSKNNIACKGMGTTIAGVFLLQKENAFITAHVGDSRVYRLRGSEIEQITVDHSLLEEQVALGLITREEAETSDQKNIITRALGVKEEIDVEVHKHDVEDGDCLLICSDGLTDLVTDAEIKETITKHNGSSLSKPVIELTEMANLNGGKDNITIVILKLSL